MKPLYVLLTIVVILFCASNGLFSPLPVVQASVDSARLQGDAIDDPNTYITFLPMVFNAATNPASNQDDLGELIARVTNGNADQVVGSYIPDLLAAEVLQQPEDQPDWISPDAGTLTQYRAASQLGNLGLLASKDSAAALFDQMAAGLPVTIIQGDGSLREYSIAGILTFQAIDPTDPNSDYLIQPVGVHVPYSELLNCIYGGEEHLVFESTIDKPDVPNWGKLFVVAFPVAPGDIAPETQLQALLATFQN